LSKSPDKLKAVEEVLGKPFALEFEPYAGKVRNRLIWISLISLFITIGNLTLDSDSSFLGLRFEGITQDHVELPLLLISLYLLIHYIWLCKDTFDEWTLRRTGTRAAFQTGSPWGNKDTDDPATPRQSTLYNWWLQNTNHLENLSNNIQETKEGVEKLVEDLFPGAVNSQDIRAKLAQKNSELSTIDSNIKKFFSQLNDEQEVIKSPRLEVSLSRFDNRYRACLESQNLRWILLEYSMPLLLSVISITSLVLKIKSA